VRDTKLSSSAMADPGIFWGPSYLPPSFLPFPAENFSNYRDARRRILAHFGHKIKRIQAPRLVLGTGTRVPESLPVTRVLAGYPGTRMSHYPKD
jgi:hypothetical protein